MMMLPLSRKQFLGKVAILDWTMPDFKLKQHQMYVCVCVYQISKWFEKNCSPESGNVFSEANKMAAKQPVRHSSCSVKHNGGRIICYINILGKSNVQSASMNFH